MGKATKKDSWIDTLRSVFGLRRGHGLVILTYHRMLEQADPVINDVYAQMFDQQLSVLAKYFNPLRVTEAVDLLNRGKIPPRAVCITFDDGYRDNHDVALPLLQKWSVPATFFVATDYMQGKNMWNDIIINSFRKVAQDTYDLSHFDLGVYQLSSPAPRQAAAYSVLGQWKYKSVEERNQLAMQLSEYMGVVESERLMMTAREVKHLSSMGMEVGAHTVTHPILQNIEERVARAEMHKSKSELEAVIGKSVSAFAYPNGRVEKDYTSSHVSMAKELGFASAVTTNWGKATPGGNQFELPRLGFPEANPLKFGLKMARAYLQ